MKGSDRGSTAIKKTLDLGLGDIVNAQVAPTKSPPVEKSMKAMVDGSSWRSLVADKVNRGEWGSVSQLCETVLDKNREDCAANIIWVQSQIKLGSMPLSLLISPLEAAVDRLNTTAPDSELSTTAVQLLRVIAGKTIDSGVAAALLEKADQIETRLTAGESKPTTAVNSSEPAVVDRAKSRGARGLGRAGGGLLVLALLAAGSYLWFPSDISYSNVGDISGSLDVPDIAAQLVAPDLQRVSALRGLEALLYDLDAKEREPAVAAAPHGSAIKEPHIAPPVEDRRPVDEVRPAPAPRLPRVVDSHAEATTSPSTELPTSRPGFESVNTSGPIEPPIFEEIRRDSEKAARREADTGQILFGEPRPEFNQRSPVLRPATRPDDRGSRSSDADAVGVTASTMVKSRLMARPSFRTKLVRELPRGAKLQLLGRAGDFFRVEVIPSGEVGYVLAQDIAR